LLHYDLATGERPENVAAGTGDDFYDTLSQAARVERVTPQGLRSTVVSLPKPADGGVNTPVLHFPFLSGIVRLPNGTLYLGYATGTDDLTGIWRVRPGGIPQRVIALGAKSMPNGMAFDPHTGRIFFADSTLGVIWSFSVGASAHEAVKWVTGAKLDPTGLYGLGVNGLKVHDNAVWVANSDQGTLLRIPIRPDGTAGAVSTKLTGISIDDFTFIGQRENIIASLDAANEVVLIKPDGTYHHLLGAADGLEGPTSSVIRGGKLYVMSAGFLTQKDPNIVVADFDIVGASGD
jgi:sugar lactone lactonase YvrE